MCVLVYVCVCNGVFQYVLWCKCGTSLKCIFFIGPESCTFCQHAPENDTSEFDADFLCHADIGRHEFASQMWNMSQGHATTLEIVWLL